MKKNDLKHKIYLLHSKKIQVGIHYLIKLKS